jgi:hypothetical protein
MALINGFDWLSLKKGAKTCQIEELDLPVVRFDGIHQKLSLRIAQKETFPRVSK